MLVRFEFDVPDIHVHIHHHDKPDNGELVLLLRSIADSIINLKDTAIMNKEETLAALLAMQKQLDKVKAEVIAKVATLEKKLADGNVTSPEIVAAITSLKGSVQGLDDLHVDEPSGPADPPVPVPQPL